MIMKTKGMW